ncbi:MAG TPA: hypothetical protein VE954_32315 [Oligoflexus sp.]|uniref:hypothetical protein n=1 Tax=Oligoflexus sp. TaxID=1971216 RepID=UPI002D386C22|nr:hypothetical protein [Oligoflexus sp.]HYX37812.1 hypothetical protein [Oligoflexus sp.]
MTCWGAYAGITGQLIIPEAKFVLSGVSFRSTETPSSGTLTLPTAGNVLTAITYGVGGTGSTGTLTLPLAAQVRTGNGTYGVAGTATTPTLADCAADGDVSCVAVSPYKAAFITGLAAKVVSGNTVAGVAGSATAESHSNCTAANQSGCVAISPYLTMNLGSAGSATGLTAANFNATIATSAAFEFWDAVGARHSVTGTSNLSAGNVKSSVAIFGVTGQYPSASYRLASNTAATDLTLFATQLTTDGSFEFFDSAGAQYTGSGDSDLLATNVKNAVAFENLSITGSYVATLVCPTGWIKVPADSAYGTNDFCVMKYEAKNVGSVATSQAASAPWVSITQTSAITACRALGTGYDIISNAQWMTIGANVAAIAGNWSGGVVGTGSLFSGHNDSNPNNACAASSDDGLFYVETDCTPVSTGDTSEQRRTLTLSNSEVIWDLSGNVYEWVNYINLSDKPGATNAYYEYTALTGTTTTALKDLVPTNAVKAFWSDAWNSGKGIGSFYPGTNGSGGALVRGGGGWAEGGVFRVYLTDSPTTSGLHIGFRCVKTGP